MNIDLVSDLHIDHWDSTKKTKYTIGKNRNFPSNFEYSTDKSNILVIAGDICDNIEESINFLDYISQYYDIVLFVDGNHEHSYNYPDLYSTEYINKLIKARNNSKIIYLPENNYKIGNTVFVGCCGWWNYSTNKFDHHDYFEDINNNPIKEEKVIKFHNNVKKESKIQADRLLNNILSLYQDKNIKNIVVVSHTLPINIFLDPKKVDLEVNTHFEKIRNCPKISHWFFGHCHEEINKELNGARYISNPRGRPCDYDRIFYSSKTISIV